jgi:hypothetical protein
MRILGIILIVLGALGLAYREITYTEREKLIDAGPLQAQFDRKKTIPIPPWASGGAIAVGVVLLVMPGGRKR